MLITRIDHLVVAALSLDEGARWVKARLGVQVPLGGQHELMGTHNRVMALGDSTYLEVIAINPNMAPPSSPRWFGLDDPHVIHRLANSPRLLTWAVHTNDLQSLVQMSRMTVGNIVEAKRDDLQWKVALTDDGRLSAGGFFPLCIQWKLDVHPATRMPDLGCRLESLTLHHPYPGWLMDMLSSIGAQASVTIEGVKKPSDARLTARIVTPTGVVSFPD